MSNPTPTDRTAHQQAGTSTMRAVVAREYSTQPASATVIEMIERPSIGPDEVLVRVAAAGVDRGVLHLMTGRPYPVRLVGFGVRRPKQPVPGLDMAGTVVAVGDDVTRFSPGDDVLGIGSGSFAEYAVASESKLVSRPATLDVVDAAVLSISGLTALQAVRDQAEVAEGDRVLVIGASGGVGSYVVQIATAFGAEVTGVASGPKLDAVRSIGARHVIDHRTQEVDALGGDYDVVIDIGGVRSLRSLRKVLRPEGRLVIVGGENGGRWTGGSHRSLLAMLMSPFVSQEIKGFISRENDDDIATLVQMHGEERLRPLIDRVVDLDHAADALAHLDEGRVIGKVAIRVDA